MPGEGIKGTFTGGPQESEAKLRTKGRMGVKEAQDEGPPNAIQPNDTDTGVGM